MKTSDRRSPWIAPCARLTLAAFLASLPGPAVWAQVEARVAPVSELPSGAIGSAGAAVLSPSAIAAPAAALSPLSPVPTAIGAASVSAPLAAPMAAAAMGVAQPQAAAAATPAAAAAQSAGTPISMDNPLIEASPRRDAARADASLDRSASRAAAAAGDESGLSGYAAGVQSFDNGGAHAAGDNLPVPVGGGSAGVNASERRSGSRKNRDAMPGELDTVMSVHVVIPNGRFGFQIHADSPWARSLLAAKKNPAQGYVLMATHNPAGDAPFHTGTVAKVISVDEKDGAVTAILEGQREVLLRDWDPKTRRAEVDYRELPLGDEDSIEDLTQEAKHILLRMGYVSAGVNEVIARGPRAFTNLLADTLIQKTDLPLADQQDMLTADSIEHRLALAVSTLRDEDPAPPEAASARRSSVARRAPSPEVEAMAAAMEDGKAAEEDAAELNKKIEAAGMPDYAKAAALKELKRMKRDKSERENIRKWIEFMVELPWNRRKPETVDLKKAKAILDAEHSGLEEVKKAILKNLAVRAQTGNTKGGVMGFEGPPGVGKTTIAKAWAAATGRDLVVISLGGKSDEKFLRGINRFYHNSDAGILMKVLRDISRNAVIVLDEADQAGKDSASGNLMAALLEVLDPEQSQKFKDTYLDVPFDLTDIMFIVTGNDFSKFPDAVKDRMKIVTFGSYTLDEKVAIGRDYATSRMLKRNGLQDIEFTDQAMRALVKGYTMEAGVRALHNTIDDLFAEIVYRHQIDGAQIPSKIDVADVAEYLGPPKFSEDVVKKNGVGMSTGLGVNSLGGSTLSVQVKLVPGGSGRLVLRAEMGDTFKDSAENAWAYIRSRAADFGLDFEKLKTQDLHVSMAPSGKIDGPSAGLAMATAIVSAITGRPVRDGVAMTGAIDLNGKAWTIGGLREKVMAAEREGYTTVLYPVSNEVHVPSIPSGVSSHIRLIGVHDFDEIIEHALMPAPAAKKPKTAAKPRGKG